MDSFQRALQTNEKLFFQIRFWNFDQKPKNMEMNSEAWILIKLHCVIGSYINGFVSTSSTNKWMFFFKFQNSFQIS